MIDIFKISLKRFLNACWQWLGRSNAPEQWVPAACRTVDTAGFERTAETWRKRGAQIGRNVRITNDLDFVNPHLIAIGDNCVIGGFILAHGPRRRITPSVVGNNVYIGWNALVLPGVSVGDNCIVGAGAVVTHDVPPNSIVAGNPATIIGHRDADEVRNFVADMERGAYIGAQMPEHASPQ